jgi:DNA helicase MCM9
VLKESLNFGYTFVCTGQLPDSVKDYQEIKVQEDSASLRMGATPKSITVVLEDDLADKCRAGDDVIVTAVVMRRWRFFTVNERCDLEIFLFANNVTVINEKRHSALVTEEKEKEFEKFWRENRRDSMAARDGIVKSFCPRIFGMHAIKLSVLLVLLGGVPKVEDTMKIRGNSHLLLVGDPGIGKSQFLRYASTIIPRSIQTTGVGSTSAGLTVAAVKDSGEWQLEAGALVLADGGICCIDEFSTMKSHDKTTLHEAMEQQTISVAKAGIVCTLNTKCSIIAATNPKGKYDPSKSLEENTALGSPLLSRFDLIFVMSDLQKPEWDEAACSFILNNEIGSVQKASPMWNFSTMQAYIQYVKNRYTPLLTDEANQVLSRFYQEQRQTDARDAARTTIRLLESLIRLSQAHVHYLLCYSVYKNVILD